jgi:REP element-mobilizing transposase RayT
MQELKGWHCRGYLPHCDDGSTQFVTFRLFDSLPRESVLDLRTELKLCPDPERAQRMEQKIQGWLDKGYGECFLRIPEVASLVKETLFQLAQTLYTLHAWVIMPNHVHLLLSPYGETSLSNLLGRIKGRTSCAANRNLRRTGRFWHPDYFDRYIRDEEHFQRVRNYIENNPYTAGLCTTPEDWGYSSAKNTD